MKTRKGTLTDAIDSVSTLDIVEAFDVPNKMHRGKVYLICPGHDDKNFGSCYIDRTDNGYYCYACGEHVNKWQMVLKLNGNNGHDAYHWFFKQAGMIPSETSDCDDEKKIRNIIKNANKYLNNKPIYNDTCACDKADSSYGRNINGEYVYSEQSVPNPLLLLYRENESLFQDIISTKIQSEKEKIMALKNAKLTSESLINAISRKIKELDSLKNTKE